MYSVGTYKHLLSAYLKSELGLGIMVHAYRPSYLGDDGELDPEVQNSSGL